MWLEEDRRWAIALQVEEDGQCPGCHGQLEETTDPANEFRWVGEGVRCHRCAVQQREMQDHIKRGDPSGLLIVAKPRQQR